MKNKKFMIVLFTVFFVCVSISVNIYGVADDKKPVPSSSVQIPDRVIVPVFKVPHIYMLSADFWSGQVLEVTGKNFGLLTSVTKFYLGNSVASIKHWSNNFLLLEYPDSPVLGLKQEAYIKKGNTIVSNKREFTLVATLGGVQPKQILKNYKPFATIKVFAAFSGINKTGMKVRFRKKLSLNPTKPQFGKILSIVKGGEENKIKTLLPSGLGVGTYLVDLIQDGRVVSDYVEFKVKGLLIFNKKIKIK